MRRCFALIMFLLLPVAGPMAAEDPMGFVKRHQLDCRSEQDCFDKYFLFQGKPVDLRLIYLLKGHFQRSRMSIASVYLDGELDRSQFFDPAFHDWSQDDHGRAIAFTRTNTDRSGIWAWQNYAGEAESRKHWFQYSYIGKAISGVYVVLADEQFGGATTLPVLMFLKTRQVRMQMDGKEITLTALDLVGHMRVGVPKWPRTDYNINDIMLDGDQITILPSSWGTEAGPGLKKVVDLSEF